ncbi:type II toxin-antitoxin system VapC family toxin [Streptomyces sp. NPDC048669]|uniref:type II toxin-antitoxin system VapC family toxin n=1 Tax=Streptomyces sp. NPDC048669 TaxID=3155267 RepID=UPI00344090D5
MNRPRKAAAPLVYFDSCIFIEVIKGVTRAGGDHEDRFESCKKLLTDFEQGACRLVMSELVYTETFHKGEAKLTDRRRSRPARGATREAASDLIDGWFRRPEIIRVEVHQEIAEEARRLALRYRLDSHDAVHLVTARDEGCKSFITLDKELCDRVAQVDLGLQVQMPSVEWEGQTSLPIPHQQGLKVISGEGTG